MIIRHTVKCILTLCLYVMVGINGQTASLRGEAGCNTFRTSQLTVEMSCPSSYVMVVTDVRFVDYIIRVSEDCIENLKYFTATVNEQCFRNNVCNVNLKSFVQSCFTDVTGFVTLINFDCVMVQYIYGDCNRTMVIPSLGTPNLPFCIKGRLQTQHIFLTSQGYSYATPVRRTCYLSVDLPPGLAANITVLDCSIETMAIANQNDLICDDQMVFKRNIYIENKYIIRYVKPRLQYRGFLFKAEIFEKPQPETTTEDWSTAAVTEVKTTSDNPPQAKQMQDNPFLSGIAPYLFGGIAALVLLVTVIVFVALWGIKRKRNSSTTDTDGVVYYNEIGSNASPPVYQNTLEAGGQLVPADPNGSQYAEVEHGSVVMRGKPGFRGVPTEYAEIDMQGTYAGSLPRSLQEPAQVNQGQPFIPNNQRHSAGYLVDGAINSGYPAVTEGAPPEHENPDVVAAVTAGIHDPETAKRSSSGGVLFPGHPGVLKLEDTDNPGSKPAQVYAEIDRTKKSGKKEKLSKGNKDEVEYSELPPPVVPKRDSYS